MEALSSPHLNELKHRLGRSLIVLLGLFLVFFLFSNDLYDLWAEPLLRHLPEGSKLIATQITTPFMVPLKLAFVLALLLTLPYGCYEFWNFIRVGLYPQEKRWVGLFLSSSLALFYSGVAFAYGAICPAALRFFTHTAPESITLMIDIENYSSFMLSICCYAGLVFETPVLTFGAIQLNWVSLPQMIYFRKYVVVAAFIIGMLLTPPDVLSQVLLALPMWALFELGILAARWARRFRHRHG